MPSREDLDRWEDPGPFTPIHESTPMTPWDYAPLTERFRRLTPRGKFGNGECGDRPCSWECTSMLSVRECTALSALDTVRPRPEPSAKRQPPPVSPTPRTPRQTYVIQAEGSPLVKIGVSNNPETRVAGLQTGQPFLLTLAWACEGDFERALHVRFAAHRSRGEWFDLTQFGDDPVETVKRAVADIQAADTASPRDT